MPLRIGYYMPTPAGMGGKERHLLALIDHFRAGYHISVFCDPADAGNLFHAELNARGLRAEIIDGRVIEKKGTLLPSTKNLPLILRARGVLAAARLDVIHFHGGRLGFMYGPIVASWLAGIPRRILTAHSLVEERSPVQRWIEGRLLRRVDTIVAISDAVKEDLVSKKAAMRENVIVIPNGIDAGEFQISAEARSEARAALGVLDESPVVGMVGRLDQAKGADILIRAAAVIRRQVPQLRVVLIGAGPAENEIKRLAREHVVSDIVHFAGYRRDARQLMHALDLLVLASRHEGQSLSMLEAMACGKAVVAANVGGIPGVLLDGVTGLLFPSENVAALADAVVKLLADPKRRAEMGRAGRRRVETDFSQATMMEKTLALYQARVQSSRLTPIPGVAS
jgi:glycosyltransferase involved in cell wall biosynthesis